MMHFFSSHHTAASNTVYIIPSYSFSYSLSQAGKKTYISLTYADLIFPSHRPTISNQVKLLPYIFVSLYPAISLFYIILSRNIMENLNVAQTFFNILSAIHYQDFMFSLIFTCTISSCIHTSSSTQLPLTEM